jgi:hypothetical protein
MAEKMLVRFKTNKQTNNLIPYVTVSAAITNLIYNIIFKHLIKTTIQNSEDNNVQKIIMI